MDATMAGSESFRVEILTNLDPLVLPYARKTTSTSEQCRHSVITISQEIVNFAAQRIWKLEELLAIAFIAYLARISEREEFEIGYARVASHQQDSFAAGIPCRIALKNEWCFEKIFTVVREQIASSDRLLDAPHFQKQPKNPVAIATVDRIENCPAIAELTFAIVENEQKCCWSYYLDVFEDEDIARMQKQFETFIGAIATSNQRSLAFLPLLSERERQQILVEWNDTQADYPQNFCLHQLFEERVRQDGDRVAVSYAGKRLTYRELNDRANELAFYLQQLGVKKEVLVGICVERSLSMVIGLLAILKAGGAYVPLDPTYPPERLAYMLSDANVAFLLTQQKWRKQLPCSRKILDLEKILASKVKNLKIASDNPARDVESDNLAYVIYTSGSTGNPKGVAIAHHSAINTIIDINRRFAIGTEDRVLALSSLSFDLSVYDIFGLLAAGGAIALPDAKNTPDPACWLDLLVKERVTVWNSAPALMEILVDYLTRHNKKLPDTLRLVLLSGDRIPVNLTLRLKAINDKLEIVSLGGATEASIWSIYYPIKAQNPQWKSIPYGYPLSNQSFYILDAHLQPVPPGIAGELYIGGVGLARCYLNRPQLTQEKFIRDPFSDRPDARLYKTGDIGRYRSDGSIEFLGRLDRQVKIRGIRIELGEIETVLAQHPDVRESAAVVRDDRLIAYIVPHCQHERLSSYARDALRCFLKEKLPDYMVPSTFVILDALPLTPNGKIDRRALPDSDRREWRSSSGYIAPRNLLERQLVVIWEKLLKVKPISVKDDFFELGGHSLLAMRLFVQIEKTFGKTFSLATLFQAPTIEQLASIISQKKAMPNGKASANASSSLVAIQPQGYKPPFFCIHEIGGNIFYYRGLEPYLGNNRPLYGLQAQGLDSKQTPHSCVEEMAAHYIKEIRTLQPEGPYFLGGHSFGGLIAFEMARQLQRQGQQVALLALFDCLIASESKKISLAQWGAIHLQNLNQLETSEKLVYLWQRILLNFNKSFPGFSRVYLKLKNRWRSPQALRYQKILENNLQAQNRYIPQPYSGKITLFRAQIRPPKDYYTPSGGWENLALGGVEMYDIPGDHLSLLLKKSNLKILARQLKVCLDKAQKSS
jgi:amino acid adenylation domain-containing protein